MKRILGLVILLASGTAWSAPSLINYQGRLTDSNGNPVANGNQSITFKIFDASSGGNLLWCETNTSVATDNGIFSVVLGNLNNCAPSVALSSSVFSGNNAYLVNLCDECTPPWFKDEDAAR